MQATPSASEQGRVTSAIRITPESHAQFAQLSGDVNPLHTNEAAARRMAPGGVLAYGMDLTLRALDTLAEAQQLPESFSRIRVRFLQWVYVEDEFTVRPRACTRSSLCAFDLTVRNVPVAALELFAQECASPQLIVNSLRKASRRVCPRNASVAAMEGYFGVAAVSPQECAAELYPHISERWGADAVAECAACSYVIGMEAPGLRSLSVRYELNVLGQWNREAPEGLGFTVTAVEPRFRKVTVAVAGKRIAGTLEGLVRADEDRSCNVETAAAE